MFESEKDWLEFNRLIKNEYDNFISEKTNKNIEEIKLKNRRNEEIKRFVYQINQAMDPGTTGMSKTGNKHKFVKSYLWYENGELAGFYVNNISVSIFDLDSEFWDVTTYEKFIDPININNNKILNVNHKINKSELYKILAHAIVYISDEDYSEIAKCHS